LRSALSAQRRLAAASGGDSAFYAAKILSARFYADYVLSQSSGLAHGIMHGAAGALAEGAL
jgi:3-(methylthio)propanoyl-CoA dehydrogenase